MTSLNVVKGWSVSLAELALQNIRTAVGDLALLGMTSYRECAEMWYRSQRFVVGLGGGLPILRDGGCACAMEKPSPLLPRRTPQRQTGYRIASSRKLQWPTTLLG